MGLDSFGRAVLYKSVMVNLRNRHAERCTFEQDPRGGNHYSIREICDRLQRHAKHFECGRRKGKWNLLVA